MSELVVVLKGGNKQRNVKGAVLADKAAPPFAERRDGYRLRWWGADHPASVRIRALVERADGGPGPGDDGHHCEVEAECHRLTGVQTFSVVNGQKRRYICGFRNVGTVPFCAKRKRLLSAEMEEAA